MDSGVSKRFTEASWSREHLEGVQVGAGTCSRSGEMTAGWMKWEGMVGMSWPQARRLDERICVRMPCDLFFQRR